MKLKRGEREIIARKSGILLAGPEVRSRRIYDGFL